MEILPIVFSVVVIILAIILSVVGVQFIFILLEVKKTLHKLNTTIDMAEVKLNAVLQPFQNFGGLASGLGTGFRVFETFVSWLQRNKDEK
jgi:uncharacterized membrane protein